MMWLGSLDRRDRILLTICLGMVLLMIVLLAVFAPEEEDRNPTPSSYATGSYGAKAAYLLLEHSGYRVERWTRPLKELNETLNSASVNAGAVDSQAGRNNVTLILAEPSLQDLKQAQVFVLKFLEDGGRVVATGLSGGLLLPQSHAAVDPLLFEGECDTTATGFGALANSGEVYIRPHAVWSQANPLQRAAYLCNHEAVVVTYSVGKGQVVWWADSLPLENAGISRGDNLSLLLNSVGPPGTRVVWDESLHLGGDVSLWSYARGTPLHLVWGQLAVVAFLLLVSYGRRSGPLRPDPVTPRASSLEFVQSLGSLYHRAGATNTAVTIAYQQFRHVAEKQAGVGATLDAAQASSVIARRFRYDEKVLTADLAAAEGAAYARPLTERRALTLVQALSDHQQRLQNFTAQEGSIGTNIGAV